MNFAGMKYPSVSDGPGVRISLFVSGCELGCIGCFNYEAQSFDYGKPWTHEDLRKLIELGNGPAQGLTILGGDPMHPRNIWTVAQIITTWRENFPTKNIWVYSGYTYQALRRMARSLPYEVPFEAIIQNIDVLVDGPFVERKRNLMKNFRGSTNQRIIDMPATLEHDAIVLHELND